MVNGVRGEATAVLAGARMGVGPEGFWRLSLKEWRMLTAGPAQAAPLGRGELERMAALWPD